MNTRCSSSQEELARGKGKPSLTLEARAYNFSGRQANAPHSVLMLGPSRLLNSQVDPGAPL